LHSFTNGDMLTLFDVTRESQHLVVAWGSVIPVNGGYSPTVNKDGTVFTVKDVLSLDDAKDAVLKKLFDDGVIHDGDMLEG
jgi:hypothetical protein